MVHESGDRFLDGLADSSFASPGVQKWLEGMSLLKELGGCQLANIQLSDIPTIGTVRSRDA